MPALDVLSLRGLSVSVIGTRLTVWPADRLDDETREFIRDHKAEILADLDVWNALATAITECCAVRGDTDEHKRALLSDCYTLPLTEWEWYTRYFQEEVRRWSALPGRSGSADD